jgi:hypothetical protein
MTLKNSSRDITHTSALKKVNPDRQHGSARWTRARQLAVQSPRGEIATAQTARDQLIFLNPPRGRASDLYAGAVHVGGGSYRIVRSRGRPRQIPDFI